MTPLSAPLTVPLQGTDWLTGVDNAGTQAATALGTVGFVIVLALLISTVWKSRGALAGLLTGGLAGGFAYWLVKMNGLATLGGIWDTTFANIFK